MHPLAPLPGRTSTTARAGALLLVAALLLDASAAHADWWRPRNSVSGGSASGGGRDRGGSGSGSSSGDSQPSSRPRGYSPGSCNWVTISRQPQYKDPSGRMVYEITQKNTCTGAVRTFFGY